MLGQPATLIARYNCCRNAWTADPYSLDLRLNEMMEVAANQGEVWASTSWARSACALALDCTDYVFFLFQRKIFHGLSPCSLKTWGRDTYFPKGLVVTEYCFTRSRRSPSERPHANFLAICLSRMSSRSGQGSLYHGGEEGREEKIADCPSRPSGP